MIHPPYLLHKTPFAELLDDCRFFLVRDRKTLEKQSELFKRSMITGKISSYELLHWKDRLVELQDRYEHFEALVSRVQAIDLMTILSNISLAKEESIVKGTPGEFRMTISFTPDKMPDIQIH